MYVEISLRISTFAQIKYQRKTYFRCQMSELLKPILCYSAYLNPFSKSCQVNPCYIVIGLLNIFTLINAMNTIGHFRVACCFSFKRVLVRNIHMEMFAPQE